MWKILVLWLYNNETAMITIGFDVYDDAELACTNIAKSKHNLDVIRLYH